MVERKKKIRIAIAVVLALTAAIGLYVLQGSKVVGRLGLRLGGWCAHSSSCLGAPCIHDVTSDGTDSYCSKVCKSDDDCPASWVCDRTYRGGHACMKKGHQSSFGAANQFR